MPADVGELLSRLAGPLVVVVLIALAWRGIRRRGKNDGCVPDGPEDEPYRVFTGEYDLELSAAEALATLRTASPDVSRGWLQANDRLSTQWFQRADALLHERESRFEESAMPFVEAFESPDQSLRASDIFVSILIDQSGSMKGEPIAFAAVTAALLARLLERLGAKSEILGFSTAGWHGGKAYQRWNSSGRPERPGRLCALRHVVYKTAEQPHLDSASLKALVHTDLLRENVDGEAIAWAGERLLRRHEPQKILIVISDGAPVDDATLRHNGRNYLYRHLMAVLAGTEGKFLVGAIGINHRVDAWYPISETVESVEDLPAASVKLLRALFARAAQGPSPMSLKATSAEGLRELQGN